MSLRSHPTIPSKLTPEQAFESDTGILHASLLDAPTLTLKYWITTKSILPTFTQDLQEASYGVLYFTKFSTELAWMRLYLDQPVTNTISVQHTKTAPPILPSIASLTSTSPTPETTPSHNPLSNPNAKPTTALIALMQQNIQQNATTMDCMHAQTSTPSPPQPPNAHQ